MSYATVKPTNAPYGSYATVRPTRAPYGAYPQSVFGGITVGSGELRDLNEKIQHLDTDVRAFPQPALADPAFVSWKSYELEWNAFALKWTLWFRDHQTLASQTNWFSWLVTSSSGDVGGEFEWFQSQLNELLRRFVAFGGKTDVEKSSSEGPLDTIVTVLKWTLILGAVGVGVYAVSEVRKTGESFGSLWKRKVG